MSMWLKLTGWTGQGPPKLEEIGDRNHEEGDCCDESDELMDHGDLFIIGKH